MGSLPASSPTASGLERFNVLLAQRFLDARTAWSSGAADLPASWRVAFDGAGPTLPSSLSTFCSASTRTSSIRRGGRRGSTHPARVDALPRRLRGRRRPCRTRRWRAGIPRLRCGPWTRSVEMSPASRGRGPRSPSVCATLGRTPGTSPDEAQFEQTPDERAPTRGCNARVPKSLRARRTDRSTRASPAMGRRPRRNAANVTIYRSVIAGLEHGRMHERPTDPAGPPTASLQPATIQPRHAHGERPAGATLPARHPFVDAGSPERRVSSTWKSTATCCTPNTSRATSRPTAGWGSGPGE